MLVNSKSSVNKGSCHSLSSGNEGVLAFLDDSNKCHYLINTSFPHASWQGG